MRIRLLALMMAGGALLAPPASAQDTLSRDAAAQARAALHEARTAVRDALREALPRAYQGHGGPEQTERFSRRIKIGKDGSVSISNVSGTIVVTGGGGDEVVLDAVKRTRGDRSELNSIAIDVDDRGGRVDVRVRHFGRTDQASVDFTVTVPASAAVDLKSVSGDVKISNVDGPARVESVSGNVTASAVPKVEVAKSVSGDVTLTGASANGDLTASSVSGNVNAKGVKARSLDLGTVSGDVSVTDASCERLNARSVSGNLEFSGALARGGRYDVNSHSGTVRLTLAGDTGFELNATSFSGSIRSELPLTIGGDDRRDGRRRGLNEHSIHGTFGDGSAMLTVRTFSGDVVIAKR